MALVVIDFDFTLVCGHTHNTIRGISSGGKQAFTDAEKEKHWDIVKHFPVMGPDDRWKGILEKLLAAGHSVCIASFNSYGHIIPRFLQEKVGLSVNDVAKIEVVSWLPRNPASADKNKHIAQAIQKLGFKWQNSEVVLIDDTEKNIDAAKRVGYRAILADRNGEFLDQILESVSPPQADHTETNNQQSSTDPCAPIRVDQVLFEALEAKKTDSPETLPGYAEPIYDGLPIIEPIACVSRSTTSPLYPSHPEGSVQTSVSEGGCISINAVASESEARDFELAPKKVATASFNPVPPILEESEAFARRFKENFYKQAGSECCFFIKKHFSKTKKKIEAGELGTKEAIETHIKKQPHSRGARVYQQMLCDNLSSVPMRSSVADNKTAEIGIRNWGFR